MGSKPMVLGVVVDKVERVTDVSLFLDDGTGRIDIYSVEVAAIENGMYVEVHGHMKEFQGKNHAFAFSITPVIDFNDISLHFIECIYVHLENTRLKRGSSTTIQMNPVIGAPFSNGVNGYQALFPNQFLRNSGADGSGNDICTSVLRIFQEPSALDAINYLVDGGHIYSTIDEYHFKPASNGYP